MRSTRRSAGVAGGDAPGILVPTMPHTGGLNAWSAANRAIFQRLSVPAGGFYRWFLTQVGSPTGNVQFGVVKLSKADPLVFTRRMDSGIIAAPSGIVRRDLGRTFLEAGDYAFFQWADNTTVTLPWANAGAGAVFSKLLASMDAISGGVPASGTITGAWGDNRWMGCALEPDTA